MTSVGNVVTKHLTAGLTSSTFISRGIMIARYTEWEPPPPTTLTPRTFPASSSLKVKIHKMPIARQDYTNYIMAKKYSNKMI